MKRYYQILLLTLISGEVMSQTTSEQLTKEFLSGQLFIFNTYALNEADSSFFENLIKGKIVKVERLDSIVGLKEYGTIGARGVFKIQIKNLKVLRKEHYKVVESAVLKYLDERRRMFYFIDGIPNGTIDQVLDGLINKKIKEITPLGPSQAQAIWGSQGDNGALIINTDGRIDLPMK